MINYSISTMTYNQALEKAKYGKLLLLPGWQGYFYWSYGISKLCFKNGDYTSSSKVEEYNLNERDDWYYII